MVRKLKENDLAFKNSDKFVFQDIPYQFQGKTAMKFNTRFNNEIITFKTIPLVNKS